MTEDYNKAIPPSLPTKVNIKFGVAEIVDVDDKRHVRQFSLLDDWSFRQLVF